MEEFERGAERKAVPGQKGVLWWDGYSGAAISICIPPRRRTIADVV